MATINEALVALKIVKERLSELRKLRSEVAVRERFYSSSEHLKEPVYDVRKVDEKIVEIELWVLEAEQEIKRVNARTEVAVKTEEIKALLAPLA